MRSFSSVILTILLLGFSTFSFAEILFGEEVSDADLAVYDQTFDAAPDVMSGEASLFDDSSDFSDTSSRDVVFNAASDSYDEYPLSDVTRVRTGPEMIPLFALLVALSVSLGIRLYRKPE